jgi:hypothetical protein
MTDCTKSVALVEGYAKSVVTTFDAPHTSSDGGALLLRGVDQQLGICEGLAALVPDARTPERVVHSREEEFRQRVLQIALGYEDCNDAATLRLDPALRLGCTGGLDAVLSSQPSLSRFENAVNAKAIARMTHWLEDSWVQSLPTGTTQVVIDIDSTDDPTHGQQQTGRRRKRPTPSIGTPASPCPSAPDHPKPPTGCTPASTPAPTGRQDVSFFVW